MAEEIVSGETKERANAYVDFIKLCEPQAPDEYTKYVSLKAASVVPSNNRYKDFLLSQPFAEHIKNFIKENSNLIKKAIQTISQEPPDPMDKEFPKAYYKKYIEENYTTVFSFMTDPSSSMLGEFAERFITLGLLGELAYGPDKDRALNCLAGSVRGERNPEFAKGIDKINTWEGLTKYHVQKALKEPKTRQEGSERYMSKIHNILNVTAILGFQENKTPFPANR